MTPSTGLAGLDEALERHADFVRGLARRLVTDPGRADDLEQQTWMAMLRAQPTRGHGLRGWLATVTRRFAARMHREDSRRRSRETVAARPEQTESACDILQHEAAIRRVVDTVFGLDEPYRSTLVMRFYEDLTPQQIAERTGVPDATVRTRLKRGLDQVRRRLDRSGLEWRRALLPVAFGPLLPKAATAAGSMAAAATSVVPPGLGVLLMTKKTLTFTLVALCICVSAVVVFNLPDDAGGVPTTDFDSQTVVDPVANGERQDESTGKATPVDIDPFKERDGGEGRDSGRAAADAGLATVSGRVVDHSGAGVPNASVRIALSRTLRPAPGDIRSVQELASRTVTTDAEGRFEFDRVQVGVEADLRVRPQKLCDVHRATPIDRPGRMDLGDLVAAAGGSLAGSVHLPADVATGHARITAWPVADNRSTGPGVLILGGLRLSDGRTTRPVNDGTWRLDGLREGEWLVGIDVDGFGQHAPKRFRVKTGEITWDADLTVSAGRSIEGIVRAADGAPLAGVAVNLYPTKATDVRTAITDLDPPTQRTGADGRWRFRGLGEEPMRIRVSKTDYLPLERPDITPGGGEVELRMLRAGTIVGHVRPPEGIDAPEKFEVIPTRGSRDLGTRSTMRVLYGEDAAAATSLPDAPGLFAVLHVPADPVRLRVRADGFSEYEQKDVAVSPGSRHVLDVTLAAEVTIAGTVIDAHGAVVAGASVRVVPPAPAPEETDAGPGQRRMRRRIRIEEEVGGPGERRRTEPGWTAVSGADGKFSVRGLREGQFDVFARHGDHAESLRESVALSLGQPVVGLTLALRQAGAVAGRAFDANGGPASGVRVTVEQLDAPRGPSPVAPMLTDAEGRFAASGLVPGRYRATIVRGEPGSSVMIFRADSDPDPAGVKFVVKGGETAKIELREPKKATVAGIVREAGRGVPDVRVVLAPVGTPPGMAGAGVPTDDEGAFSIGDVLPGDYVLSVNPPGAARPVVRNVSVAVAPPVHEIIDLPSGTIEGRVVDKKTGKPIEGLVIGMVPTREDQGGRPRNRAIMVTVEDDGSGPRAKVRTMSAGGSSKPVTTDADGKYLIRFVAPDTYTVSASGKGYIAEKRESITVEERQAIKRIDLETEKGAAIIAIAERSGGEVPAALIGRLFRAGEPSALRTEAGPGDQPLRFDGLSPGRYRVELESPLGDGLKGVTELEVPAGVETKAKVKIKRSL